jgi:Leucine-rich repeat (LRR) protein
MEKKLILIILMCGLPLAISSQNSNLTWQSHFKNQRLDKTITWRNVNTSNMLVKTSIIKKCFTKINSPCKCTGKTANCTNRGLEGVPRGGVETVNIKTLDLTGNKITTLMSDAFQQFKKLEHIILAFNLLTTMDRYAFKDLAQLQTLGLEGNKIANLDPEVFSGLENLVTLELNRNKLTEVPSSLKCLPSLQRLMLAQNHIVNIPDKLFRVNRLLQHIEFTGNPIDRFHPNAFVELPNLIKLQITSDLQGVNTFPNLTGTISIKLIDLNRANIQHVPYNLCDILPNLNTLRLRSNKLQELPILTNCQNLRQIDLGGNHISKLPGSPFKTLYQLQDLLLDGNEVSYLSPDVFIGLQNLQFLTLEKNNISKIHKDAFMPLTRIRDLNLGQNSFPELPHLGLENLLELKTHTNPNLKEFPNASLFPAIRVVRASYAYHCCQFIPSDSDSYFNEYDYHDQLTETIYFQDDVDFSKFGNKSLHQVEWTDTSGKQVYLFEVVQK